MEAPLSEPWACDPPLEIPAPPEDGGVSSDSLARKEEQALQNKTEGSSNWPEWAKNNQIRRDDFMRHCFFHAMAGLIILVALLLALALIVWAIHLLGPVGWRWLQPAELEKLQVLVFGGAASSLATVVGKRIFV